MIEKSEESQERNRKYRKEPNRSNKNKSMVHEIKKKKTNGINLTVDWTCQNARRKSRLEDKFREMINVIERKIDLKYKQSQGPTRQ